MDEKINHPSWYTDGQYETIDAIESWKMDYHLGNAVKYLSRAGKKDSALDDLKKARWYVERELKNKKHALQARKIDVDAYVEDKGLQNDVAEALRCVAGAKGNQTVKMLERAHQALTRTISIREIRGEKHEECGTLQ